MNHGDLQRVLTQRTFIRRLARELLGNGLDAEDLEQEVYARAMQYPPSADMPVRPWLATVMRRIVQRTWNRDGYRRFAEERSAYDSSRPDSPMETDPRADGLQHALEPLDKSSRVLLAEVHGSDRSMAELAAQWDVPAATLRTRHHRAVARLRTMLDEEHHGDRRQWALALGSLLKPSPRSAMVSAPALVAAVAAIAGVTLLLSWLGTQARQGDPSPLFPASVEGLAGARIERLQSSGRTAAAPASAPEISPGESAVRETRALQILVSDEAGTPVSGATIYGLLPEDAPDVRHELAVTDRLGLARVESYFSRGWVWALAPDQSQSFAIHLRSLRASTREDPLQLEVKPAAEVLAGRVVDEAGRPLAGVRVSTLTTWGRTRRRADYALICPDPTRTRITASDGRFQLPRLQVRSRWSLRLLHPDLGTIYRTSDPKKGPPEDIVFWGRSTVSGRVVDVDAQPIPGATVWLRPGVNLADQALAPVETDALGRFSFSSVVGERYRLCARFGLLAQERSIRTTGEAHHAEDLVLEVESGLHGKVIGPQGQPLEGWHVWERSTFLEGSSSDAIEGLRSGSPPHATTDADGRFAFLDRGKGTRILWVTPPGQRDPDAPAYGFQGTQGNSLGTHSAPVEIQVPALDCPTGSIEGRVIGDLNEAQDWIVDCSGPSLPKPMFAKLEIPSGRFRFQGLPKGVYNLMAVPRGRPEWASDVAGLPVTLEPGEASQGWRIPLRPQIQLNLALQAEDGSPLQQLRSAILHLDQRKPIDLFGTSSGEFADGVLTLGRAITGSGVLFLRDGLGNTTFFPYEVEGTGIAYQSTQLRATMRWVLDIPLTQEQGEASLLRIAVRDSEQRTTGLFSRAGRPNANAIQQIRTWSTPGAHTIEIEFDRQTVNYQMRLEEGGTYVIESSSE